MARRRMFSLELISSDRFLSMGATAQSFYFHLGMHADDEGFVSAPKSLALLCKGSQKDLDELEQEGFIIRFDSGVLVIVDWLLNNTIRKERSVETMHRTEKAMLTLVDGRYVKLEAELSAELSPKTEPFFSAGSAPQNRIEENRIEENILENNIVDNSSSEYPSCGEALAFCQEAGMDTMSAMKFWKHFQDTAWTDQNGAAVRNWKGLAVNWSQRSDEIPELVPK